VTVETVVWHDLECGGYAEDLPLWRLLASAKPGPVLDVGAGTGRVTLDLARRGHEVVALDRDGELLAVLADRAVGLPVATVVADARDFELDRRFGLVLVPMQTIQLLGGAAGRMRFVAAARRHLAPGGLLAVAIADALEAFDEDHCVPPLPDMRELGKIVYCSRPVAVRDEGAQVAIEREHEVVDDSGHRTVALDVVRLDRLDAETLAGELAAQGLEPLPSQTIPSTEDYIGSTVVLARG